MKLLAVAAITCLMLVTKAATAQTTEKISLDDVKLIAETSTSDPKYVRYTLKPRWSNRNPVRTKVKYTIRLFDTYKAEVYAEDGSVEIDGFGADAKTRYLVSVFGKASDRFEASSLSTAIVKYRADGDPVEKTYTSVPILKSTN